MKRKTFLDEKTRFAMTPYVFLAVPLFLYTVWVLLPMMYSFYLSLTRWDGLITVQPVFVGLRQYQILFSDPVFYRSLVNNLKWIAYFITIPIGLGLTLAMALNKSIPGSKVLKASFYSPLVLSLVVSGLIWRWMYHPAGGLFNAVLRAVGLENFTSNFLGNADIALECIIAVAVWRQVGYVMILYLAGLQGVDKFLVDASRVDGASPWQTFWHVILPQLSPVTVIIVVISITDSLRAFDLVSVMTRGGPGTASMVLANFMYIKAMNNYRMGMGSAIAVVLFLISLGFILFYMNYVVKDENF